MIVRFITRRFIGEYESNSERMYHFSTIVDNELVQYEILDATCQQNETESIGFELNIRWADAFILMYSVTDKCSFDECNRLKFLINYNKRRRKLGSNNKDNLVDIPVVLVGNKTDQWGDRMVSKEDGHKRFREISCACFHEISVRESVDQVITVFRDVFRFWRILSKYPKIKRSSSDLQNVCDSMASPDSGCPNYDPSPPDNYEIKKQFFIIEEQDLNESTDEMGSSSSCSSRSELNSNSIINMPPFRSRASTDGTLQFTRPRRWRCPPPGCKDFTSRVERRMSVSTQGTNASSY
uniref:small monomeric GTPase n=1 Tax=Megaselia scalaris TaxID=36166 RepID=T1GFG3_MEGSC